MEASERLKAVLCDPEGKCCIYGSEADRAEVDQAITALEADNAAKDKRIAELEVRLSGQTCYVPTEFQAEMEALRKDAERYRRHYGAAPLE